MYKIFEVERDLGHLWCCNSGTAWRHEHHDCNRVGGVCMYEWMIEDSESLWMVDKFVFYIVELHWMQIKCWSFGDLVVIFNVQDLLGMDLRWWKWLWIWGESASGLKIWGDADDLDGGDGDNDGCGFELNIVVSSFRIGGGAKDLGGINNGRVGWG